MRVLRTIVALSFALAACFPLFAASDSADLPHVHVQLIAPDAQFHPGANNAGLYFKLESGWHVYWKNPGDAGEPPRIKWTLPQSITAGPLQFPVPKRLPLGPLMDFGYEDEVLFPLSVNVSATASGQAVLHGNVSWLVCRGSCIPEKAELEITRPIGSGNAGAGTGTVQPDQNIWARLADKMPQAPPANLKMGFVPAAGGFRMTVITGHRESEASFFPATQDILSNPAPQTVAPTPNGLTLDLKKDETLEANPKELDGLLTLSGGRAYELIVAAGAPKPAKAAPDEAAAPTGAAAPGSGSSAANSATTNSANAAGTPHPSSPGIFKAAGLAFVGGLILNLLPCVFPVLFIKGLSLVQSGAEERHKLRVHGFVYTAGIVVSFWLLVAVLIGLRSAGTHLGWGFQFQSPVFLSLIAALLFFLGLSLAGQFEIGLTLTSAGGSLATKQGYTGSFFTGVLAVIVATPCTAPFMGVALGYALSQTAVVTFAVFTALALGLAAPYVALTLQPAWTRILPRPGPWMEVLKQAVSIPIFGTVIWLAWVVANAYGAAVLAALLVSFLLLAIAGWFLGRWPAKRWSTVVAILIAGAVVAISSVAPGQLVSGTQSPAAASAGGWQPWSAEAVQKYQAQGRPVFVDFTASWCLSCQVNERVALSKPEVQKAFADANVVLLKADWTRYDDSITRALNALGRSGVPTYAIYVPGESQPRLLPEVLTPGIVTDAVAQLPHSAK
jgi:thiol:disulfide interchange protein/DsbC/DsbD-like thiol-disulfide interchange protein